MPLFVELDAIAFVDYQADAGRRQPDGKFTRDAVVFLSEIVFLMFMAFNKKHGGRFDMPNWPNRVYGDSSHEKRACIAEMQALFLWALRDSNPRPSACKADALNQLS